jgi:uncharacterized protein YggE
MKTGNSSVFHFKRQGGKMSRKWLFLGAAAAAALLAGCSANSTQPCTVQCDGSAAVAQRTLSVIGEGKVAVAPDIAVLTMGIIIQNPSVSAAWDEDNAKAQAVIAALEAGGVKAEDIRSDFSLTQQQRYDSNSVPVGDITYIVNHTLTVTARDLTKVGALLGAAQAAGVNSVSGVTFSLEDPTNAVGQARALAVANAKERAEELAKGLGVKVGKVLTVNEYGASVPMPMDKSALLGMGGGGSSVPIQAGTWQVSMTINVVFEIE